MRWLVKLRRSIHGVTEIKAGKLDAIDKICHVCLSYGRRLYYLGVNFELFQRICNFGEWNSKTVRVCWECLAILRRVKFLQAKCFEAIASIALGENPVRSLSTLTWVVNHDNIEANPILRGQNAPNDSSTEDDGCNSDPIADEYDYEEDDHANTEIFTEELRAENSEASDDTKTKTEGSTKLVRRKSKEATANKRRIGLMQAALKEHFVFVKLQWEEVTKFKEKVQINADELKHWRGVESISSYYVNERYKCKKCIFGFQNLEEYKEHKRRYHDRSIGRYMCDICCTHFATKRHLARHVVAHYKMYRCVVCAYQCFSKRRIKCHIYKHKRAAQCVHCRTTCANFGAFQKHYKQHHSVFICDHCGKKYRTKYTLEKHVKKHSEAHVCAACGKQYASRKSLRNHVEMKHSAPADAQLAYCVQCDRQYPTEAVYRRHLQASGAHAAERRAREKKKFPCSLCSNVYSRRAYMMNHYRHVHMQQSKHYCSDCDKYFLNRTRYVDHRKYHHEGEAKVKDKVCNICGRGFAAQRTLINHIRTHSGERPFACTYCDASFTQKHGLLSHVKYIHKKTKRRGMT